MHKLLILLVGLLVVTVVNFEIYQNEKSIKQGKNIYLRLAPVDPRALMMGDYMSLRYSIESELRGEKYQDSIVLYLDKNQVAKIDNDKDDKQKIVIKLTKERYGARLKLAHRYYFQEGFADRYQKAKYGRFKIDGDKILLVGLADEEFEEL